MSLAESYRCIPANKAVGLAGIRAGESQPVGLTFGVVRQRFGVGSCRHSFLNARHQISGIPHHGMGFLAEKISRKGKEPHLLFVHQKTSATCANINAAL